MLYYYAYYRRADPLLHHLLSQGSRLEEVYHLLHLYYLVNPRDGLPVTFTALPKELDISLPELAELSQQQSCDHQLNSCSLEQLISLLNVSEQFDFTSFYKNVFFIFSFISQMTQRISPSSRVCS